MPVNNRVSFDEDSYRALKKRYERAVERQELSFSFQGREYITLFAKYLLQYLETAGLGKVN